MVYIFDFDDSAQMTKEGRNWIIHQDKDAYDMDPDSHAPELSNSTHDEKVDIWSIGVISYMLLTGRNPFPG